MATLVANLLDDIQEFSNRLDIAAVTTQVRDPLPSEAISLLVATAQNTAGGADIVEATLELPEIDSVASGGFVGTALLVEAALRMGAGRDRVIGTVELTDSGNEFVALNGIVVNAPIVMGADDDTVIGTANAARRNPGGEATVTGLRGDGEFVLNLGDGDNTLIGQSSIVSNGEAGIAIGFEDMVVVSGVGTDNIVAIATLVAPAADRQIATGFSNTFITGGGGEDLYSGFVSTAFADQNVSFAADGLRLVDRGGPNEVSLEAEAEGGLETLAVGMTRSTIETGAADDQIEVIARAGPAAAMQSVGAVLSTILTGAGDDSLTFSGQAIDGGGTTDVAGLVGSVVETGEGDDILTTEAVLVVTPLSSDAKGIGTYQSQVDLGDGDDLFVAAGAEGAAGVDLDRSERQSVGISLSSVELGAGDDSLVATGADRGIFDERDEEGVFLNVISGGAGDDVFDIQNGTGFIDGGEDVDTLILAGSAEDFAYRFDTATGILTITDDERTEIEALNIETYGFADQPETLFALGDLLAF